MNHFRCDGVEATRQEEKIAVFFLDTFCATVKKHFKVWLSSPNIICAIGGEGPLASAFSNWLINGTMPNNEEEYRSILHDGYTFNICNYVEFISTTDVTRTKLLALEWTNNHRIALEAMVRGVSLWEDTTCVAICVLRQFVKTRILPFMSSTHWIEFLVEETSLAATTKRDDSMRSAIVMIRSMLHPYVARATKS